MTKQPEKKVVKKVVKKPKKATPRVPSGKQIRAAQLIAENVRSPKPKSTGNLLREAGYSDNIAEKPSVVTSSPTFQALLERYLPDDRLAKTHARLLETRKLDHMVFPLGPAGEDDPNLSGSKPNHPNQIEKGGVKVERSTLTDAEIKKMLKDVNCTVRRIVHGDTGRHVYFWTHDAQAQKGALELAYKMKGVLQPKQDPANTFNFINNQNFSSGKYTT